MIALRPSLLLIATASLVGAVVGIACSSPDASAVTVLTAPDRSQFDAVGPMLIKTCGTLDCHGQYGRNMRLFGNLGLRVDPNDWPGNNTPTTATELDEGYNSVVGLEPALMTQVVSSGGANPDSLTMVRKARGIETHKGGKIWDEGDDRDVCLTSWLSGSVDTTACTKAAGYSEFP